MASPLLVKPIAFYRFANLGRTVRMLCHITVASIQHANAWICFCPLARSAVSNSLWRPQCAQQVLSAGQVYHMPYGLLSTGYLLSPLNYRPGKIKQVKTECTEQPGEYAPVTQKLFLITWNDWEWWSKPRIVHLTPKRLWRWKVWEWGLFVPLLREETMQEIPAKATDETVPLKCLAFGSHCV